MRPRPSSLVKSLKSSKSAPVALGVASAGLAAALMVAWVRRRARRARVATTSPQPPVDLVDEGSMESFPASDPPSTMSPMTSVRGKRPRS